MPKLELLASGPGTGKTTYCIDLFRKEILSASGGKSRSGLDSRAYFVLPNREHAGRIQNLVLKKEIPGLFNVHILTIQELASRLFPGGSPPKPGEALRRSLLRRILENSPAAFPYFAPVRDLPGFYEILSERVQELSAAMMDARELERRAKSLPKDPVFRTKTRDFVELLKIYEAELEARGIAEVERPKVVPDARFVIFDGFYHFTQAQKALVQALSKQVAHGVVSLTLPGDSKKRPHVFALTDDTRAFLARIGFKASAPFATNYRVQEPALLHLESQLFLSEPKPFAAAQEAVRLFSAETTHEEVESIAREIRRLHRDTDWHFSDMAVILRSVRDYDKPIAALFQEYEIPVYIHERKKLIESGLGRFVHRLLCLFLEEWKNRDLLPLLKSGYRPPETDVDAVSRFERLAFSRNVLAGREEWMRLAEDPSCVGMAERLAWYAEAERKFLSARSARGFRLQFVSLLCECRLDPSDAPALGAIEDLLLRAEPLDTGEAFAPKNFLEDFQRSLEAGLYSQKPSGKNRVQVYDTVMAIPKEYRVVFIAGLLDQAFPKTVTEDAFFKDDERKALNLAATSGGGKLELRASRLSGERYFFYMAVTRARNRLYLSYPKKDRDGRSYLPSAFIEETRRCFKGLPVSEQGAAFSARAWAADREAEKAAAETLFSRGPLPPAAEKKRVLGYAASRKKDARFIRILEAGRHEDGARFHDRRILEALAASEPVYSSTRLETYLTCAFKYFAQHTLKLRPYFENRLRLEMGTLLHAVLERFYKATSGDQKKDAGFWKKPKRLEAMLTEDLERLFPESPLASEPLYRRRFLLARMKRTLALFVRREIEYTAESGLVPAHFELEFGRKLGGADAEWPFLKMGRLPVLLEGKIDRVDISSDGKEAYIIDYKLGFRDLKKKIEKGIEVQLPVYMLAAERLLGLDVRGGELRFLESGKKKSLEKKEAGELMRSAEERIARSVENLKKGDIAVRSKSCDHCDFESVCRFEKWRLIYSEADAHG